MMEVVIFVGVQGAGKSRFFRERFFDSHVRINLDMLRTRFRERVLLEACLQAKQRFVVDNTNPTVADRCRYIKPAKECGFRVVGYFFQCDLEDCKRRNGQRSPEQVVPLVGLLATYKKLVVPSFSEGFDALYVVRNGGDYSFTVEEWSYEV